VAAGVGRIDCGFVVRVRSLPDAVTAEPAPARATARVMAVVPLPKSGAPATPCHLGTAAALTLAELGLPVNPARAVDAIDTELLIRRDGPLAVRFVC
jgi:hypothetical protein